MELSGWLCAVGVGKEAEAGGLFKSFIRLQREAAPGVTAVPRSPAATAAAGPNISNLCREVRVPGASYPMLSQPLPEGGLGSSALGPGGEREGRAGKPAGSGKGPRGCGSSPHLALQLAPRSLSFCPPPSLICSLPLPIPAPFRGLCLHPDSLEKSSRRQGMGVGLHLD